MSEPGVCMYVMMSILIMPELVFSVQTPSRPPQKKQNKKEHTPIQYTTKQPIKYQKQPVSKPNHYVDVVAYKHINRTDVRVHKQRHKQKKGSDGVK